MTWRIGYPAGNTGQDVADLLQKSTAAMKDKLLRYQKSLTPVKLNMTIIIMFEQGKDPSIVTDPPVHLVTDQFEVFADTDIDDLLVDCASQLADRIVAYEHTGSGWVVQSLLDLDTTIWKLDPLRAETYHALPEWVSNTHCVVNVRNTDNECFRHNLMAGLYTPKNNRDRVSSYTSYYEEPDAPNLSRVEYPFEIRNIVKFEADNEDISVSFYGIKEKSGGSTGGGGGGGAPDIVDDGVGSDDGLEEGEIDSMAIVSESESEDESETEEDREFIDNSESSVDGASFYRQFDQANPVVEPAVVDQGDHTSAHGHCLAVG